MVDREKTARSHSPCFDRGKYEDRYFTARRHFASVAVTVGACPTRTSGSRPRWISQLTDHRYLSTAEVARSKGRLQKGVLYLTYVYTYTVDLLSVRNGA